MAAARGGGHNSLSISHLWLYSLRQSVGRDPPQATPYYYHHLKKLLDHFLFLNLIVWVISARAKQRTIAEAIAITVLVLRLIAMSIVLLVLVLVLEKVKSREGNFFFWSVIVRDENSVAALIREVTDNENNLPVVDSELVNGGVCFSHGFSIG